MNGGQKKSSAERLARISQVTQSMLNTEIWSLEMESIRRLMLLLMEKEIEWKASLVSQHRSGIDRGVTSDIPFHTTSSGMEWMWLFRVAHYNKEETNYIVHYAVLPLICILLVVCNNATP